MLDRVFNLPPDLPRQLRTNILFMVLDCVFASLHSGSTGAFLNIYASRCGATSEQIGLLTALPALLALFVSLPAGRWVRGVPARRVTMAGAFFSRILLAVYVFLPGVLPVDRQYPAILLLVVAASIPMTFLMIGWNQFFMEAIPSEWRAMVMGARGAVGSVLALLVTLISGQILTRMVFPRGYQVVFLIGFFGMIMTVLQMARIHPVETVPAAPLVVEKSAPARKFFPSMGKQGRAYLRVNGFLFLFSLASTMAVTLIPNLLVNRLKLTDEIISIGVASSTVVVLLSSLLVPRVVRRTGNRRAASIGMGVSSLQTGLLAVANSAGVYLGAAVMGGAATGILNIGQYGYLLDNVPDSDRSVWLSMNVMLGNISVFLGAVSGPLIARGFGASQTLWIFAGLEVLIGLLILKWG